MIIIILHFKGSVSFNVLFYEIKTSLFISKL